MTHFYKKKFSNVYLNWAVITILIIGDIILNKVIFLYHIAPLFTSTQIQSSSRVWFDLYFQRFNFWNSFLTTPSSHYLEKIIKVVEILRFLLHRLKEWFIVSFNFLIRNSLMTHPAFVIICSANGSLSCGNARSITITGTLTCILNMPVFTILVRRNCNLMTSPQHQKLSHSLL